ncbi:MAG: carboxypeptidase-like regulatory domain-containing protein, partial [Longimicrobiales bacterium]
MHLHRSLVFVAGALALPGAAHAQTLRGQVVEQGSLAPVVAAQIVLIDSAGRQAGTVLTNEQGQFVLRAPSAGHYTFRADMIGRKSGVSRPIDLAENAVVEYRMELEVQPVSLGTLTVRGRAQCGSLSSSIDVHTVWEEARKALAAEAVTREQQLYRFTLERHDRLLEAGGRRVVSDTRTYKSGYSSNPYVTLPADTLAEQGYLRREGADRILYGPTGDVLL